MQSHGPMPGPTGRTRCPKPLPPYLETPTLLYLLSADPKAGCWPQSTQPDPRMLATPQGGISPALPFPSLFPPSLSTAASRKPGKSGMSPAQPMFAAQLHPISACGARNLRASPSPGRPPGVVAVSTGGGSHHHPGPGHHTAHTACSLRCQHGVRSGQALAFRRMRASRVISRGREGGRDGARPAC